jgi:hypothetical protein
MASPEEEFIATYERTRNTEKERVSLRLSVSLNVCFLQFHGPDAHPSSTSVKPPDSNPTHAGHECTRTWSHRDFGSQETPSQAYNGTHTMAKRTSYSGGIWATIVRGCAAR